MAGLLMASAGAVWCFVANAASYIPFIFVALWILPRGRVSHAPDDLPHAGARRSFADLRTLFATPHVGWALCVVATLCFLCSPLLTFCPVLVRDAFGASAGGFSLAVSAFGVGGLLGGIALLGVDTAREQRRLTIALAVTCGASVVGAALAPAFWIVPLVLIVAGATLSMTSTLINTLLQVTASPERRGQTISLVMFAMRGGMALGSLATGAMVGLVGVRTALVINGVLAVTTQLTLGAFWLRCRLPEAALERA
jgi:predicted MFS family arabinose efflux permease